MISPRPTYAFDRACARVLAGEFAAARRLFGKLGSVSAEAFGRRGSLDSPAPAEHPGLHERLRGYLVAEPACAWGRVFLAFAARSEFDYAGSIAAMEQACRLESGSAVLRALLGRLRFARVLPQEAVSDLEAAVLLAPKSGWIRSWLGEARRLRGDLPGALRELDAGVAADPWYGPAFTWRAAALDRLGRSAEALRDATRAVRLEPRSAWARHLRMGLRQRAGDVAGALADAAAANRFDPKFGWIAGRPGDPGARSAALALLDAALAKRPRWPWALAWRGWTRLRGGDAAGAYADLAAAGLADARVRAWRGRAAAELGRAVEARRELSAAAPRLACAQAWLAELLEREGRLPESRTCLDRALALDPLDAAAWRARARVRRALGDAAGADEDLRWATALLPEAEPGRALAELGA